MQNRVRVLNLLEELLEKTAAFQSPTADRIRSDLQAARFHLTRSSSDTPIVAVTGGTGTGKSTLINRLTGEEVTATSFRRTFTAGPIAIAAFPLPPGYLGLAHASAETKPPRGSGDRLVVVAPEKPPTAKFILIDSPDIDGELREHHVLADRVFRWADAVIFLVTPEKYQMTELQPYYRLAQRYGLPVRFVMNKADDQGVVDDYESLLKRSGVDDAEVLAIPRDDATWHPPADRDFLSRQFQPSVRENPAGQRNRVHDATARLNDQMLQPLLADRLRIEEIIRGVRTMLSDAVDVDVHPLTHQLQQRMRERSVLYLIGPQRIIDRVRTMPQTLVQLPRSMWGWARDGEFKVPPPTGPRKGEPPDFKAVVTEQFLALQNRLSDLLRQTPSLPPSNSDWKIDPAEAGAIVDKEIGELRQWLETRWSATPRDTAILQKLLKVIPGGRQLTKYSEAAPYLLAVVCAAKGAVFGHIDLLILGSYSAVTWLSEKINDEVAGKTRATNRRITDEYERLATRQVELMIRWLDGLAPSQATLQRLIDLVDEIRRD